MLERIWRKGNPPRLLVGSDLVQPPWKTVWSFLQKLKIELPYDSAGPLLGIYSKKDENSNSKRYMHPNVHSTTYSSQDMGKTQVPTNKVSERKMNIICYHLYGESKNATIQSRNKVINIGNKLMVTKGEWGVWD